MMEGPASRRGRYGSSQSSPALSLQIAGYIGFGLLRRPPWLLQIHPCFQPAGQHQHARAQQAGQQRHQPEDRDPPTARRPPASHIPAPGGQALDLAAPEQDGACGEKGNACGDRLDKAQTDRCGYCRRRKACMAVISSAMMANTAAASEIIMWVRSPAGRSAISRSMPSTPPMQVASSKPHGDHLPGHAWGLGEFLEKYIHPAQRRGCHRVPSIEAAARPSTRGGAPGVPGRWASRPGLAVLEQPAVKGGADITHPGQTVLREADVAPGPGIQSGRSSRPARSQAPAEQPAKLRRAGKPLKPARCGASFIAHRCFPLMSSGAR